MCFIYRLSYGGAARTMMNIVNHLDREKFEPILVTLDFTFDYEQYVHDDVRFIKLDTKRLRSFDYEQYVHDDVRFIKLDTKRLRSAIMPLAKLIRQEQPDIVFSTIPNYNTIAILATLLSRTKTNIIVREAAYLGGSFKENLKLRCYELLYRFANKVIALSNGVKENLISRYHVKRDLIEVIYNPVDIQYIEASMKEPLAEPYEAIYTSSEKVIVTAGRLVKEK